MKLNTQDDPLKADAFKIIGAEIPNTITSTMTLFKFLQNNQESTNRKATPIDTIKRNVGYRQIS